MGTHSTILAWRIPWTEGPGGLQSTGSQRVRHNQATYTFTFLDVYHSSPDLSSEVHSQISAGFEVIIQILHMVPSSPTATPGSQTEFPLCSFPSRASHPPGHSHLKSRTRLWPYLFLSIYIQRIKKSCRISFQTLSQTFSLFYRELSKMQIWSCCSFLLIILNFF